MDEDSLRALVWRGSWGDRARWIARIFTPWGLEWWLWKRARRRHRLQAEARLRAAPPSNTRVEDWIRFLVARGLDEYQVREGSVPEDSLDYMAEQVLARLQSDRPLRALHIGNFVGISLSYISLLVRERHRDSLVVSVDPNIPHRGIDNPQSHAVALLDHLGLLERNLMITGYTLERSDEAVTDSGYAAGVGPENVLAALFEFAGPSFDLALIDGSHEEQYLAREIAAVRRLLRDDGIVVFDDVKEWAGVAKVFRETAADDRAVELGENG